MSIWETQEEKVARYEADDDFPGYNMSEGQVERFWEISAENLEEQSAFTLKVQLEGILNEHGQDADEAMFTFLGSETISSLLEDYEEADECGWKSVEDNWKSLLIDDLLYLNKNYSGDLEEIWMNETRWGCWEYLEIDRRSESAFNAVVGFLSGYPTLGQWIGAC